MRITFYPDGSVAATYSAAQNAPPEAEWYPDDTRIAPANDEGKAIGRGPIRVLAAQPDGWGARAARQWDPAARAWAATGSQPSESDLERAIRLLENNQVPDTITLAQARVYFVHIREILLAILIKVRNKEGVL